MRDRSLPIYFYIPEADLQPNSRQLFVCCQADRSRHNYAQIHIVQNPRGLDKNLMVFWQKMR